MKPLPVAGSCCGASAHSRGGEQIDVPRQILTERDVLTVIAASLDDSALTGTLLTLLDERHPVYNGASTPAVVRIRATLLQALGHRALPATALPFVLEELESAHDARLTATAARVLRRFPEPSASFAEPLLSALSNIRHRDEVVELPDETTATAEVIRAIAWLGSAGRSCIPQLEQLLAENPGPATSVLLTDAIAAIHADAESVAAPEIWSPESTPRQVTPDQERRIAGVRFQDHAGTELTFADAFHGRPSIVVFFYTRCDNPTKCPLTMFRFGALQRRLQESGAGESIGLAAITYDPEYDRADRLLQYAESWGVKPSATHRILRTLGDFAAVSEYFSLGVNFSASGIVNRHQLEAFVVDGTGRIAHAVTRRRWDEAHLIQLAESLRQ